MAGSSFLYCARAARQQSGSSPRCATRGTAGRSVRQGQLRPDVTIVGGMVGGFRGAEARGAERACSPWGERSSPGLEPPWSSAIPGQLMRPVDCLPPAASMARCTAFWRPAMLRLYDRIAARSKRDGLGFLANGVVLLRAGVPARDRTNDRLQGSAPHHGRLRGAVERRVPRWSATRDRLTVALTPRRSSRSRARHLARHHLNDVVELDARTPLDQDDGRAGSPRPSTRTCPPPSVRRSGSRRSAGPPPSAARPLSGGVRRGRPRPPRPVAGCSSPRRTSARYQAPSPGRYGGLWGSASQETRQLASPRRGRGGHRPPGARASVRERMPSLR